MAPKTGRMAVVLPQGALFRKGAEGAIRQQLIEEDLIEAVIGLAPNIFYGTSLAPAVIFIRHRKPEARRGKIMIIDASALYRKGRAQNFLDSDHARQIAGWVKVFKDVQDRARVVTVDEVKTEDYTLNISRYVLPPIGEDIPPLPEAVKAFKEALKEAREAEADLRKALEEGGWLNE